MSRRQMGLEIMSHTRGEVQEYLDPFDIVLPKDGRVVVEHGSVCFVGQTGEPGSQRISIICAVRGCGCGCGEAGRAVMYTPSPANARMLARQLIEQVDAIEAEAAASAAALLLKAAGK